MAKNSSRERLFLEIQDFAAQVPQGALVLDAGAGTAPYRSLFNHATYESADFLQVDKDYAPPTYECDLANIPVDDERFDFIIFNQVMEHLPSPSAVLSELHRVLKPGGKLLYSGPLFYEEHEQPYDFFRFTQFGVRHLAEEAGFDVESLNWLEGYLGTVGYQLNGIARSLPVRPGLLGGGVVGTAAAPLMMVTRLLAGVMGGLLHRLELYSKVTDRGYPKNYVAILGRPVR